MSMAFALRYSSIQLCTIIPKPSCCGQETRNFERGFGAPSKCGPSSLSAAVVSLLQSTVTSFFPSQHTCRAATNRLNHVFDAFDLGLPYPDSKEVSAQKWPKHLQHQPCRSTAGIVVALSIIQYVGVDLSRSL